mmetsp:Transcript_38089/g.69916  ORF Transcript_38089/g.69916 Transcript_38089/m.69916 type:complete len:179 (-) Transcript_38089:79-615(-)
MLSLRTEKWHCGHYRPSLRFCDGGWIVSATGVASFGFFFKYKKGQSVPSGQTQFTFMTGGFEFLSISYQWLVITCSDCAKFKGIDQFSEGGLFNDIDHSFMLTACDGGKPDVDDTFRVKIWSTADSSPVYDNVMGADESSYIGTVIRGGNIQIRQPKKTKKKSKGSKESKKINSPFHV